MLIIDTDVLIWYLRGNKNAAKLIDSLDLFYISAVSYIEVVQGMRNKKELSLFKQALVSWRANVLHITEVISVQALTYVEQHYLDNSVQLADALIASTAISNGLTLVSGNTKHFKIFKELNLKEFKA